MVQWPWQRGKQPDKQEKTGSKASRKPHPRFPGRDVDGKAMPGFTPNLSGRPPKAKCITDAIRERGEEDAGDGTGRTRNQVLADGWWTLALNLNPAGMKEVTERIDGKVPQTTQLTGAGGGPIEVAGAGEYTKDELAEWERVQLAKAAAKPGTPGE